MNLYFTIDMVDDKQINKQQTPTTKKCRVQTDKNVKYKTEIIQNDKSPGLRPNNIIAVTMRCNNIINF